MLVSVLTRLRQEDWPEFEASWGYRGRAPFQKQQRAGEVGETGLEKKQYPRKRQLQNVQMTKYEAHTHTNVLCIFVYDFVCVPCVLCVCRGGGQILSFHVYVGSSN